MTEDNQKYTAAPPPATQSAPDSISLAEFAETDLAAQNAASWDNIPDHGNRDGSAKLQATENKAAQWIASLEAPVCMSRPQFDMLLNQAVEGLEGRVRGVLAELRRCAESPAYDAECLANKLANESAADLLEAVLLHADPPAGGDPGMLTAEEGWRVWRELLAAGSKIEWSDTEHPDRCQCWITSDDFSMARKTGKCSTGRDPDPLRAFSKAVAAFRAAATEQGQE